MGFSNHSSKVCFALLRWGNCACPCKVSRCSHHCFHNIDASRAVGSSHLSHIVFVRPDPKHPSRSCLHLSSSPISWSYTTSLTYSTTMSDDNAYITFFLAWHLAFHSHCVSFAFLHSSVIISLITSGSMISANIICIGLCHFYAILSLLCHNGNVKYQH